MPTRRSLHAMRPSASVSSFAPGVEGTRRPDRDAAPAQVQSQGRSDRAAEVVLDRDGQEDPRARASVERVGKEMRRQRWQDVLRGAVLVDVARDTERGELPHLVRARNRPAEHQNGQPSQVERPDGTYQLNTRAIGQPRVEHDQVDLPSGARQLIEQRRARADGNRTMTTGFERSTKSIADELGVVGDDDGSCADRGAGHLRKVPI